MGEISPILHKCFQRNSKEDCSPTHSRWQPDPNPKTQQRRWKNGNHRRSSLTTRDAKILAKSEPIESYADKVSPNQRNAVSCTGSRNRNRTLRKNEWNLNRVWSWVNKTLSAVVHCVGQMCHRTVSNEKQGGTGCELCRTHTHTHTERDSGNGLDTRSVLKNQFQKIPLYFLHNNKFKMKFLGKP